jgi:hypothetical protein
MSSKAKGGVSEGSCIRDLVCLCVSICLSFLDAFQWGASQYIKFFQIAAAPFPLIPPVLQ